MNNFETRARKLANTLGWTVDFSADGTAWFLDAKGHDIAQSYLSEHLDALESEFITHFNAHGMHSESP